MMKAVVTTGNGGFDRLVYGDVATPLPGDGEVLLRVLAAGVNNTEINTRLGWYSSSVDTSTSDAATLEETAPTHKQDGGWNAATPFPLIQETDCCGRVVEVGPGVDRAVLGERVLVRPCMRPHGFDSMDNIWMASDFATESTGVCRVHGLEHGKARVMAGTLVVASSAAAHALRV